MSDHAVCLFQRRAGGHDVVHDEPAFVHCREQVAARMGVAEVAAADQQQREDNQGDRMFQREAQGAFVNAHQASARDVTIAMAMAAGALEEIVAECRRPGQRQGERGE